YEESVYNIMNCNRVCKKGEGKMGETNTVHKTNKRHSSQAFFMFQKGMAVGFPIMLGYLPIAITYGVLAKQSGLTLMELTLMSVLVFAGASQFMGANMLAVG